jgi:hypothetical protein
MDKEETLYCWSYLWTNLKQNVLGQILLWGRILTEWAKKKLSVDGTIYGQT